MAPLNFPGRFPLQKPAFPLIPATVNPTLCLEKGWFCPTKLHGYLCTDIPAYCDSLYKTGLPTGYPDSLQPATAWHTSPLYEFDAFDRTALLIHFAILPARRLYADIRIQ